MDFWHSLYSLNRHLLSEEVAQHSKNYLLSDRPTGRSDYDNYFWLDGSSDRTLWAVMEEFIKHRDQLVIPKMEKPEGTTLFFTFAEGWVSERLINTLHLLIDWFKITGPCFYECCSVNVQEMYDAYCEKNNLPKKITGVYFNRGFLEKSDPKTYVAPLNFRELGAPYEDKRLYTCLNWNGWEHRLALIGLLHYHDLITDGYVTSPGVHKFSYHPEFDFAMLVNGVSSFFEGDEEKEAILQKLTSLRDSYPLKIDDRSRYHDTDQAIQTTAYVQPIYEARLNGLIEVVSETLYTGEHFFSEKTFWPMILSKPLIMVTGPGALVSLKKIGFKTFDPYINESYDLELDPILRLKKVVLELKRLKELRINDPVTFKHNYDEMVKIGSFNKAVFANYRRLGTPTC